MKNDEISKFMKRTYFQAQVLSFWELAEARFAKKQETGLISEVLCLCCVAALKSLPTHSFNALIIPIHYHFPLLLTHDILYVLCTAFRCLG